jgi:ABC-2 type transport system ATP-binding protein
MREIRALLRDLSAGGVTVLLSSHLLAEVEQVCSHAVVMDRGKLVSAGLVSDLIGAHVRVYLEVTDIALARRVLGGLVGVVAVHDDAPGLDVELDGIERSSVVAALVKAGVGVETVTTRNQLEDAFLTLLGDG